MTNPSPHRPEEQDPRLKAFRKQIALILCLWTMISLMLIILLNGMGLGLAIISAVWLTMFLSFRLHQHNQIEAYMHYRQQEALHSIYALLPIRFPLPPMRLWAVSPDFVTPLISIVMQEEPKLILELGSGVSTLLCAYCLEQVKYNGQIISIDHEITFVDRSKAYLKEHKLNSYAEVIYVPLMDYEVKQSAKIRWYDTRRIDSLHNIDLLIVDGPPSGGISMNRYPALPVLFERLSEGAMILIDDYLRPTEQEMVELWLQEFDIEVVQYIRNEKGAIILQKGIRS